MYPEAAGLAVRLAAWWHSETGDELPLLRLVPTLKFLAQSADDDGLVWQESVGYLFDTAIVLGALHDAQTHGLPGGYRKQIPGMYRTALKMVSNRTAAVGAENGRWSYTFGPHLLKAIGLLMRFPNATARQRSCLRDTATALLSCQRADGAFAHAGGKDVYLHAHCYALEGLCYLQALGMDEVQGPLAAGVSFLATQQLSNGLFPRWPGSDKTACDTTAQAGRLFLATDADSYVHELQAAGDALARCVGPGGGITYQPGGAHENSWCTFFSLQLFHGLNNQGLKPGDLV